MSKSIAFIGSGPISLIKALIWAENHPDDNIVIFTDEEKVGGAWKSETSPQGYEIENGCHIWTFQPTAYQFLEQYLNLELGEYTAPPFFIYKNKKYKYSVVKTFEGVKRLSSFIKKWDFFWIKDLFSYYQFGKNFYQNKYLYPKYGSPALINQIIDKVKSCDSIDIKYNTKIDSIDIQKDVILRSKEGNQTFDQVFITSVTQIKSINSNNDRIDIKPQKSEFIHFLISMDQLPNQTIGYCRLIGDPIIHRYTDVSYQTDFKENLFLVGIFEKSFHKYSKEDILNHIQKTLAQNNIIEACNTLKLEDIFRYETNYIPLEKRKAIKKLPDNVTILHSTDLMFGIKKIAQNKY